MFTELITRIGKPEYNTQRISEAYRALWEDEHISKGMLQSHLNPDEEGATCKHSFVYESVQWIAGIAPPSIFHQLLDLGCGPGVYAERFAKEGYAVTGIDYAIRSVNYATEQTKHTGSGIAYLYQNYLTMDFTAQFNVITLINKDYAVFSAQDRQMLLKKVYAALKPGGQFIFDVMTPPRREKERRTWEYCENGGFFCAKPHLLMEAVYQNEDTDKTQLQQYIIVTDEEVREYICPNHFFTKELLTTELQTIGFKSLAFYGDVAGKEYSDTGEIICCVLTK